MAASFPTTANDYQAVPTKDGSVRGYALYAEYGDEWALVPESAHLIFNSEAEALAFADELENGPPGDEDPNNTFRGDDFAGFAGNH